MDLLATVRKEGSRGGAGDFKWSDVQNSSRRENYLGHSLMAPVGRWQKGRDLNWYAKNEEDGDNDEDAEEKAARERKEEIRRIKEAEEDALARALGLPVAPRSNANTEPLGDKREVDKLLKESAGDGEEGGTGIGYGSLGPAGKEQVLGERIEDDTAAAIEDDEVEAEIETSTADILIEIGNAEVESIIRGHQRNIITDENEIEDRGLGLGQNQGQEMEIERGIETAKDIKNGPDLLTDIDEMKRTIAITATTVPKYGTLDPSSILMALSYA